MVAAMRNRDVNWWAFVAWLVAGGVFTLLFSHTNSGWHPDAFLLGFLGEFFFIGAIGGLFEWGGFETDTPRKEFAMMTIITIVNVIAMTALYRSSIA